MVSFDGFDSIEYAREWFSQRRWFGDKGRDFATLVTEFAVEVPIDGSTLRLEVVEIGFADGVRSRYLLLRDPDIASVDRIEDAEVRAWLMIGFIESRTLTTSEGDLRWSVTDPAVHWAHRVAGSSRVFRGEQSNTSIVYGEEVMVKLFRKLQTGQNPEVEIGQHLTLNTDFSWFPRLFGTITLFARESSTTIAAAQQFVPSKGDAWSWLLDGLADAEFAVQTRRESRLLGTRTAMMHAALANGTGNAFEPELVTARYATDVRQEALRELEITLAQLDERGIPDAKDLGTALKRVLADLNELEGTFRVRIHGDYHLGQVLRTTNEDFVILDFEGEPSRSLEERRAKASPLRDVAGMLRSFDYAAETARRRYPGATADDFSEWRGTSRQAFLEGYATGARGSLPLAHGLDPERRRRLVAAFEVHKALYEVRYELGNRPDWVDIPLRGLRRIVGSTT